MGVWDFGDEEKKRKGATRSEREEIILRQDSKCNTCETKFSVKIRPHIDHKDGNRSNKKMSNLQAICPTCHDYKTRQDNKRQQKKKQKKDDDPWNFSI